MKRMRRNNSIKDKNTLIYQKNPLDKLEKRPDHVAPHWIASSADLYYLCSSVLPAYKFIYLDTEFQREKTYFPLLSLIQIATDDAIFFIDVLSKIDLSPLKSFFLSYAGETILFSA